MALKFKKTTKQPTPVEVEAATVAEPRAVGEAGIVAAPETAVDPEPPEPLPDSFLSVAQAAAYAGVSQPTIRRWIKAKVFTRYRSGKQWRIDPKDIVSFMRRNAHC